MMVSGNAVERSITSLRGPSLTRSDSAASGAHCTGSQLGHKHAESGGARRMQSHHETCFTKVLKSVTVWFPIGMFWRTPDSLPALDANATTTSPLDVRYDGRA
jgi:hypothetical protein